MLRRCLQPLGAAFVIVAIGTEGLRYSAQHQRHSVGHSASNFARNDSASEADSEDYAIHLEVLEGSVFSTSSSDTCICPAGQFYHWRAHACIPRGGKGYECGFFPAQQHNSICKPGFYCKRTAADSSYRAHRGASGDSYPATCMPCDDGHPCKDGDDEQCLTEYNVTGETCFTVRVEIDLSPIAEAIDSFDLDSPTGGSSSPVTEVLVATDVDVVAVPTSNASEAVVGNATKTVCVSVADAKEFLEVSPETRVDEALAGHLVEAGQLLAFEQAFLAARAEAVDRGMLIVDGLGDDLADEHDRAVGNITERNVTEGGATEHGGGAGGSSTAEGATTEGPEGSEPGGTTEPDAGAEGAEDQSNETADQENKGEGAPANERSTLSPPPPPSSSTSPPSSSTPSSSTSRALSSTSPPPSSTTLPTSSAAPPPSSTAAPSSSSSPPPSIEDTAKALRSGNGVADSYDQGKPGLKRKVESAGG